MNNSISNESIWGKLSEMDKKLNNISAKQEPIGIPQITSSISKEEVINIVSEYAQLLGRSNDSHFQANLKNINLLNNNILKTKQLISELTMPESVKLDDIRELLLKRNMIRIFGFNISRTSIVLFSLILFSSLSITKNISQHDNYTTLEQKYSRQSLIIHELQSEIEKSKELENKKKKK